MLHLNYNMELKARVYSNVRRKF